MATPAPDRRPGDDRSLRALYDLVPDAYELDLLEESRRPAPPPAAPVDLEAVRRAFVAGFGFDPVPEPAPESPPPTTTQAQFLVERLLGGRVVDDPPQ